MSLRVLEVIVQPIFVLDRDGELEKVHSQPVTMTAKQFDRFCADGLLEQERDRLEKQLSENGAQA